MFNEFYILNTGDRGFLGSILVSKVTSERRRESEGERETDTPTQRQTDTR